MRIRLLVALLALVVGASLSMAGMQMQTILNDRLDSPFTRGIPPGRGSGRRGLGAAHFPFAVDYIIPVNAFLMAMLTSLAIHALSLRRDVNNETIILPASPRPSSSSR
ncbi:iron chelate uptake ABC transporter family permease subunit [Paracoccus beibuensis]|uniref:iron chelate uptake ABC transporter family permease subunit n=1 Tax=Paracoccus beibuensis TaxID=547602 RepID=UPI00223F1DEE|nr:iron chelate uptake ABC transporter family permease subunit [Paracoccus beibuensis]